MNIEELLERYTPTQLEKELESPCPFYREAENTFSGIYLPAHELANNLLVAKLQNRLNAVEIATEQKLEGAKGRVDIRVSARNGKLDVRGSGKKLVSIELKTGGFKLVQPAAYAAKEGTDILLTGLKNSEVQVVSPKLAEDLLHTIAEYLETREKLKEEDIRIPSTCKRCSDTDCGYAGGRGLELNKRDDIYEEKVKLLNGNLDAVAEKIEGYIRKKLESDFENKKNFAKAQR